MLNTNYRNIEVLYKHCNINLLNNHKGQGIFSADTKGLITLHISKGSKNYFIRHTPGTVKHSLTSSVKSTPTFYN